jgi:hypothetical protein
MDGLVHDGGLLVSGAPTTTLPPPPEVPVVNSADYWTLKGTLVENAVECKQYVVIYEDLPRPAGATEEEEAEQTRLYVEFGMLSNLFEYLEHLDGTPQACVSTIPSKTCSTVKISFSQCEL